MLLDDIVSSCCDTDCTLHFTECMDGQVRLENGSSPAEGRVEVCRNKQWGTVCGYTWDNSNAREVCGLLGYSDKGECKALGFGDPL